MRKQASEPVVVCSRNAQLLPHMGSVMCCDGEGLRDADCSCFSFSLISMSAGSIEALREALNQWHARVTDSRRALLSASTELRNYLDLRIEIGHETTPAGPRPSRTWSCYTSCKRGFSSAPRAVSAWSVEGDDGGVRPPTSERIVLVAVRWLQDGIQREIGGGLSGNEA